MTTKNLEGDYSEKKVRFISKTKFEELKRSQVIPGDILVAKIGSIGKTGIYPKGARIAIIPANLLKFTVAKTVNFKFVFHYLNSYLLQKDIRSISTATAQPAFNLTKFRKLRMPLPPLSEQQQIVSKIEELFSELDKGKQQLETVKQQLKTYRQAVLKWAFEGRFTNKNNIDGQLPEGWKWVKTGEVIETIFNGYTPKSEFLTQNVGEIPFIKVYNLKFDGTLNFEKDPTFIPRSIHEKELKRSRCHPNDVLINIVGPPLGKVSVVPKKFKEWNINQAIVLFRPNERILSKFISFFLQNPTTINWLEDTSKATAGQWNVKVSTCRIIPIPLPPIPDQEQIISEIETRLSVCDKIEEIIEKCLQQTESLRQSILKQAFEGKLIHYVSQKSN